MLDQKYVGCDKGIGMGRATRPRAVKIIQAAGLKHRNGLEGIKVYRRPRRRFQHIEKNDV